MLAVLHGVVISVGVEGEVGQPLISLDYFTPSKDDVIGGSVDKGAYLWRNGHR